MTKGKLRLFLEKLQTAFLAEDWDDLSAYFRLPLVIYTEAGVAVFRDSEKLVRTIREYRAALACTEIAATTLDVEHRDTLSNERLRATVRITDFGPDGQQVRHSLIRYFLVEDGESYKIEMLEYIKASLPLNDFKHIIH
ncbi:MAG: hypothetical protein ACU0GG_19010 [Paracoccaceae bacterium]